MSINFFSILTSEARLSEIVALIIIMLSFVVHRAEDVKYRMKKTIDKDNFVFDVTSVLRSKKEMVYQYKQILLVKLSQKRPIPVIRLVIKK